VEVVVAGGVTDANAPQLKPVGRLVTVRATVALKLFRGVTVIVCRPFAPAFTLTVTGVEGAIEKSTTWNVIVAVTCVNEPLVPVTVRV
jgi:hypothetical protein